MPKEGFAKDAALLKLVGLNPVVVHGGGPQINQLLARIGKQANLLQGMRVTDSETIMLADGARAAWSTKKSSA